MGVYTGATLLLMFIVGSHANYWLFQCPYKPINDDPRVCANDGITYESICAFKRVQSLNTWLAPLYEGPCKDIVTETPPRKRTTPAYYEDDYEDYVKPTRRRRTTPRHSDEYDDHYTTKRRRRTTTTTPAYSDEYDDYIATTKRRRRTTTPAYLDEYDDYIATTPRRRRTTTLRRLHEDDGFDDGSDYIYKPPGSDVNVSNQASNKNDVKYNKKKTGNVGLKIANDVKNSNNINVERHARPPIIFRV